jgi:hypothetical protein
VAGTPTKITPAIAALLTDEHAAGASFRELERKHPGLSRARIAVHVKRELQRRQAEADQVRAERRATADHARAVRADAEAALPPRVRRQLAGQFIRGDNLSALLDANDYASNLRAERIRERGLHPLQATNWQVDCDDNEWRDYLASRDTWPPHVDPEKATKRWRLGTAIK